jgi:hypothetical protein
MDIAVYINTLLEQHQTVVVPGLGTFYRSRVDGFFNPEELKFYPPSLQIQFEQKYNEDEALAELISADRHISAASARYFIESYINNIRQQALQTKVPFAGLGTFKAEAETLIFDPEPGYDDQFYGLEPVTLRRNSAYRQQESYIAAQTPAPSLVHEPVYEPELAAVYTPEPATYNYEPQTYAAEQTEEKPFFAVAAEADQLIEEEQNEQIPDEDEPRRGGVSIGLIVAIFIIILGAGLIALYKYKPALFKDFIAPARVQASTKKTATKKVTDSTKAEMQAKQDIGLSGADSAKNTSTDATSQNTNAQPAAATTGAAVDTFRIVVSSFKTLNAAKRQSEIITAKGFESAVVKSTKAAKSYKVVIGTYFNLDTAKTHLKLLQPKFKPNQILLETYPYKP